MGKAKSKHRVKTREKSNANVDGKLYKKSEKGTLHNLMGKSLSEEKNRPGMFRISCMVKPNARRDRLYIEDAQVFVDITSPPVKGKANVAIIRLFHDILHVPKSHIHLVKGQTSHQKMFQIWAPNLTCEIIWKSILQKVE
jgi:hypothetical protein